MKWTSGIRRRRTRSSGIDRANGDRAKRLSEIVNFDVNGMYGLVDIDSI